MNYDIDLLCTRDHKSIKIVISLWPIILCSQIFLGKIFEFVNLMSIAKILTETLRENRNVSS